jgi:hypothetical protein
MLLRPRSRIHYWSCSKFADFVRGEKKPFALEWGKWDEWKNKRPNRLNPMEKSGWNEIYDSMESNNFIDKVPKFSHKQYMKLLKIEKDYDQEDENMMVELIKIRSRLWA